MATSKIQGDAYKQHESFTITPSGDAATYVDSCSGYVKHGVVHLVIRVKGFPIGESNFQLFSENSDNWKYKPRKDIAGIRYYAASTHWQWQASLLLNETGKLLWASNAAWHPDLLADFFFVYPLND